MNQSLIFDIKRYAIHDGPGIRISIFFKGCPLSCKWCHNPESWLPEKQKLYTASRCIGARDCIAICPEKALTLTPEGIVTNADLCTVCGKCADSCPTKAMEISGKEYLLDELMAIIERERVHIEPSGGGVTFTGGEPLMHTESLLKLLEACGKKGLHRTVDTSGHTNADNLLAVAKHTDLFLYDLKHMNSAAHKQWTGAGNERILKNLRLLTETGAKIIIRIPLIKNVNTSQDDVLNMAEFISNLPGEKPLINILPYHALAKSKYVKLEKDFQEFNMLEPDEEEINSAIRVFKSLGLHAEVG